MNIHNSLWIARLLDNPFESAVKTDVNPNKKGRIINIPFKGSDPKTFEDYLGQDAIKERIKLRLNNFSRGDIFKALFSAPAGIGKTALSRIVANRMAELGFIDNYYEVVASKFEAKNALDEFIASLKPYSYVFIDEVHGLAGAVRDALLPTLQDEVYAFGNEASMIRLPTGISWTAATTDIGQVHAAIQRRFTVFHLEPMSFEDRFTLVFLLAQREFTPEALTEVARRCWTPWEIKDEALVVIEDVAEAYGIEVIDMDTVQQAFRILGIDENGLRFREIEVLKSLFKSPKIIAGTKRFALSASALMATSGIDKKAFYGYIEPKLLQQGFLTVSSSGRELTEKALQSYFIRE